MKKHIIVSVGILLVIIFSGGVLAEETRTKSPAATPPATPSGLVELNKASKEQLMTLPGIGEEEAQKIIEGRPYSSKSDLRKRGAIPAKTFYGLIDKVTIQLEKKQPDKPASPAGQEDGGKPKAEGVPVKK